LGYPVTTQNLSPMMVRYLEYKERYPDALLFFQVGDFYELFYDDAVTVAKALNLTLTSRDKNSPEPVPMCGVPISVLDGYLDRLVPLGYSVAVVSQTGSGQGVERTLERFVTPGMRLFTSVSSDATECVIAAVVLERDGRSGAVACTDPQTGVVRVKEGIAVSQIPREVASWVAREVVVPRVVEAEKIDRRTSWVRGIEGAVGHAAIRFRAEPVSNTDSESWLEPQARNELYALGPTGRRAVRLLASYLDEISLGNPLPIRQISLALSDGVVAIDAATRRNLELLRNTKDGSAAGTLYGFLNTTETPGGARLLQSWLMAPLAERDPIARRQASVAELLGHYRAIAKTLAGINDLERLAARIQLGIASPRDLGAVRDILERLPSLQDSLAHCQALDLSSVVDRLLAPMELRSLLCRSLSDNPPHVTNDGGIIREAYDAELDQIRSIRGDADAWRDEFEVRERQSTGIQSLKVRSNNILGYFIEIPSAHAPKAPQHYQRRQSTANAERFCTPELKKYEDEVVTAVDRQVRREQELFVRIRTEVQSYVADLRRIAGALAELDVLAALARAADTHDWVAPEIVDGGELCIENGRHPIIERLLSGGFIPNSVEFGTKARRCFVVTGPNMGGKSTYLRQIALITILAQIGSYVPAKSARIGLVDRIFARLGAADDLHEGESTFMVEMREAALILAHATQHSLVLIDELGRGTATTDGQALAHAILEELALQVGCRTLFATHYHELTGLEQRSEVICNLSVGSVEDGDRVVFTHEIQPGPAPRSYGLEVAKLSGLPAEVLARAGEILQGMVLARTEGEPGRTALTNSDRQQSLFALPEKSSREKIVIKRDPVADKLLNVLRSLDLDAITAREALQILYQLKNEVPAV
jgi:DNA mismatch repair protein MutS